MSLNIEPDKLIGIVLNLDVTAVEVRAQQGKNQSIGLATIHADAKQHGTAMAVANFIAKAISCYAKDQQGYEELQSLVNKIYRLNHIQVK